MDLYPEGPSPNLLNAPLLHIKITGQYKAQDFGEREADIAKGDRQDRPCGART
jgi:hypothetical protein